MLSENEILTFLAYAARFYTAWTQTDIGVHRTCGELPGHAAVFGPLQRRDCERL